MNCRHMTGDHHGGTAGRATLLVRAMDEILGTHKQCRGRHREDPGPPPPRDEPGQRSEPGPIRWLVPGPADVPAQHRVLMPQHRQFSVLRMIPAEHQRNQPE